jgi:hypothetical protein
MLGFAMDDGIPFSSSMTKTTPLLIFETLTLDYHCIRKRLRAGQ